MSGFRESLREQRWDDHRYYHQSRINQSLHFVSAISFLSAYVLLFINPPLAAIVAWVVAMGTRQSGHFFFEPKGYDHVNDATHEHKEAIKVGYNLRRKVVLHAVWALSPLLLLVDPTLLGLVEPAQSPRAAIENVGWIWLAVGVCGLAFRMLQLFAQRGVATGVVWVCKIVTDPFHDLMLYWRAPLRLMRGELIDPMWHARAGGRPH